MNGLTNSASLWSSKKCFNRPAFRWFDALDLHEMEYGYSIYCSSEMEINLYSCSYPPTQTEIATRGPEILPWRRDHRRYVTSAAQLSLPPPPAASSHALPLPFPLIHASAGQCTQSVTLSGSIPVAVDQTGAYLADRCSPTSLSSWLNDSLLSLTVPPMSLLGRLMTTDIFRFNFQQ